MEKLGTLEVARKRSLSLETDVGDKLKVVIYKGSAPRAADAARYARARKNATKTCKGGRKRRPMIWCEQRIDNAKSCLCRANCRVLCCVLVGGVTF